MNDIQININLNFQQLLEAVKQLSPIEKLELNEFIWNENIDIPEEQQKLVEDRINQSKQNPDRMLDWNKVMHAL